MVDFVEMILFHAAASPGKPAIITHETILTYDKLRQGIFSLERHLRQSGLKAGDCVAISINNPLAHVTLMCALFRAGIVSISVDPPQLQFLDDVVVDAILSIVPVPDAKVRTVMLQESWFGGAEASTAASHAAVEHDPHSLSRLIFSSGTTGRPKIIGLSRDAVNERLISYAIRMSTPSWDRLVCLPGLSTNYGFSFTITALWLGRTVCFGADVTARQVITAHQADFLVASTHQISTIVREQEEKFVRLESLRSIHIGGSVAYAPLLARIRMLVCPNVYCGYGSTEGGTVAYAPADAIYGMDRAVGIVAPWIDLEIVDEQNRAQDYGIEGQIRLRALGQGYRYTKISETEYKLDDAEWFYPGDQGILGRNGLLVVTGRINEIINRGGVKIAPDSIEEAIKKHPLIADAAATSMLDGMGIEQIWVAITTRDGRDIEIAKVYEFCRTNLTMFIPDRIFQVAAIPRNALGKVARESLKEQLKTLEKDLVLTLR
jgi:acyl-coenzyme A synthetase/AMP-(fatty) acid ligase